MKKILLVLLILAAWLSVHFLYSTHRHVPQVAPHSSTPAKLVPPALVGLAPDGTGHAMIPGGIPTLSVFLAHRNLYPGFNFDKARFDVMPMTVKAHVSYRLRGHTYYTIGLRYIFKGEPIVTDGHTQVLRKCGNILLYTLPDDDVTQLLEPEDLYPPIGQIPPDELPLPALERPIGGIPNAPKSGFLGGTEYFSPFVTGPSVYLGRCTSTTLCGPVE